MGDRIGALVEEPPPPPVEPPVVVRPDTEAPDDPALDEPVLDTEFRVPPPVGDRVTLGIEDPFGADLRTPAIGRRTAAETTGATSPDAAAPPPRAPRPAAPEPLIDPVPLADNAPPVYPRRARRRGWTGVVLLEIHVRADGTVADVEIAETSGHTVLDRAALEAALGWRFEPAHRGDVRVARTIRQPIRFSQG
jgi:periplasmic protein TonB